MFSTVNVISGLAFATNGSYSEPNHFAKLAVERIKFNDSEPAASDVTLTLKNAATAIDRTGQIGQQEALDILVRRDMGKVANLADAIEPKFLDADSIARAASILPEIAAAAGLDTAYAELRIVDSFPPPYENAQFAAMTYDLVDEKVYGIRPGVALLSSTVSPLYSINLFAHELVHVAIGRVESMRLARGLEEGLADLVGLYFSGQILGRSVAESTLMNSRLRYGRNQLGRLYRDSLIHACGVALIVGESGILDVVRRGNRDGREYIKDIESATLSGIFQHANGVGAELDDLQRFALRYLGRSPDVVVSPLAMFIGEHLDNGVKFEELFDKLHVEYNAGVEAIRELENRVYVAVESNGRVDFTESKFYAALGQLRYDV